MQWRISKIFTKWVTKLRDVLTGKGVLMWNSLTKKKSISTPQSVPDTTTEPISTCPTTSPATPSEPPPLPQEPEPPIPTYWPKSEIDQLSQHEYLAICSENIAFHAADVCIMLLKMKIIMRTLQVEGVMSERQVMFGETMVNEFITSVKNTAQTPDRLVNIDQIMGRLIAFTVKSGMTPGAVVSFEKRQRHEQLN